MPVPSDRTFVAYRDEVARGLFVGAAICLFFPGLAVGYMVPSLAAGGCLAILFWLGFLGTSGTSSQITGFAGVLWSFMPFLATYVIWLAICTLLLWRSVLRERRSLLLVGFCSGLTAGAACPLLYFLGAALRVFFLLCRGG
jgi:hypothetical protein